MTGACVDEDLDAGAGAAGEELGQVFELALEQVMVVAVAGVDGDVAACGMGQVGERVFGWGIGQADDNDAARLRPEGPRMGTPVLVFGEPAHVAMLAGGDIGGQTGASFRGQVGGGLRRRRRGLGFLLLVVAEPTRPGALPLDSAGADWTQAPFLVSCAFG